MLKPIYFIFHCPLKEAMYLPASTGILLILCGPFPASRDSRSPLEWVCFLAELPQPDRPLQVDKWTQTILGCNEMQFIAPPSAPQCFVSDHLAFSAGEWNLSLPLLFSARVVQCVRAMESKTGQRVEIICYKAVNFCQGLCNPVTSLNVRTLRNNSKLIS